MASNELRQQVLTAARRIVVKVGSHLLTARGGRPGLDARYIGRLTGQIAALRGRGYEVTLVSSGAVAAGAAELGLSQRPTDVAELQAVAAIGQRVLMAKMHAGFAKHGLSVGQVLLTRSDFDDRVRFLNIRNCISHLHEIGAVPVLNENDTVAVDEIRFGDNDLLAALTCNALRADALLLLTVVDGLLDEQGRVIELVRNVADHLSAARQSRSAWGSGGMISKLEAARVVTDAGEIAVIAHGRERAVIERLLSGEALGTVFLPAPRKMGSRQRWIALTARPAGTLTIDDGAVTALTKRNKSLLASGIRAVTGRFERGEVLIVRDANGKEVARGLSNYGSEELRQIMGRRSSEFEAILGRPAYAEVIHRDNLVVTSDNHRVPAPA